MLVKNYRIKTLGLCPKPRKGTRPLDPFYKFFFHLSGERKIYKDGGTEDSSPGGFGQSPRFLSYALKPII
jgi:hypothetical protein